MQGRDDIARIASARAVEIASRAISLASSVKGEKGDKGEPGEIVLKNVPVPGEKGEQGEKGERGYTGAQGPKGDKGDKGDRGTDAVGAKGDKGDKGDTGPQGERGFIGPRGFKGDEGERGLTGPIPKHEIKGLKFRFQQDDGEWGKWIIVPTGGGGGGRDDKLFDRQKELMEIADAYKSNTNPFPVVYPAAGIPNSTGSAWGTSYGTTGTGSVVLSDSPTITGNANLGSATAENQANTVNIGQGYSGVGNTVNIAQGGTATLVNIADVESGTINIGKSSGDLYNGTETFMSGNVYLGADADYDIVNVGVPFNVSNSIAISGTLTASSTLNLTGATSGTQNIATTQTTGSLAIGGTSATGTTNIGRSTVTHTFNLDNGTLGILATRTINIGVAGASSSLTNTTIGTTGVAGSTRSVTLINGTIRLQTFTVTNLPTGVAGARSFVTNALAPTFGAAVVGGGAVGVPVYHDGISWKVG